MTYALSLVLWMTAAQANPHTAAKAATPPTAAPIAAPPAVVVQCPPSDCERALRAQLDEARSELEQARGQLDQTRGQLEGARRKLAQAKEQVAKLKEEASMPDHAVAALLLSDHPDLAPLERTMVRSTGGAGRWRLRHAQAEVYVSRHPDETMTAVVLTLRNPREAPTWEPKEAFISAPYYRGDSPVPVAVQSSPQRIRPGETARIALAFDRLDVRLDEPYTTLTLLRDGEWEMEILLHPSDFQVASTMPGDGQ